MWWSCTLLLLEGLCDATALDEDGLDATGVARAAGHTSAAQAIEKARGTADAIRTSPEGAADAAHTQHLLTEIFVTSLRDNPAKKIGGILYFDEESYSIVQVIEGPTCVVRALFHERIYRDTRHTAVKKLWDMEVKERRYEVSLCSGTPTLAWLADWLT